MFPGSPLHVDLQVSFPGHFGSPISITMYEIIFWDCDKNLYNFLNCLCHLCWEEGCKGRHDSQYSLRSHTCGKCILSFWINNINKWIENPQTGKLLVNKNITSLKYLIHCLSFSLFFALHSIFWQRLHNIFIHELIDSEWNHSFSSKRAKNLSLKPH